jgi:DNA-binding transcriptional ArsR family regulator
LNINFLEWLKNQSYEYIWNFKIGTKIPDIIAFKDKEIVVFDFKKKINEVPMSIRQCLYYLHKANKAYIVLPYKFIKPSLFKILKKRGVGLIRINEDIKVLLEAKLFHNKNEVLIKKLKKRSLKNISFTRGYKEGNMKEKILKVLEKHPEGLTTQTLSQIIGAHRQTITKYVLILEGNGKIYRRRVGSATLHYLKEKFFEILERGVR